MTGSLTPRLGPSARAHRRQVAGVLGVIVIAVSIALPVLDAREPTDEPAVETAHEPGRCASRHDHAACSHLARSQAVQTEARPEPSSGREVCTPGRGYTRSPHRSGQRSPSLPRAPPPDGRNLI